MDMSCRPFAYDAEALEHSLGDERNRSIQFICAFHIIGVDEMPEKELCPKDALKSKEEVNL